MCFAGMTQITKQIFNLSFLYIFIFVFILYTSIYIILVPTSDKHTPINNDENNNKWIYNLNYKKRETVLPTKSIEDLNTFDIYMTSAKIAIIIIILIAVLIICYCCRKMFSSHQVGPANDTRNVEVEYPNNFELVSFLPDI